MPRTAPPRRLSTSPRKTQPQAALRQPLWKGPKEDGITFSLLSRFLVCRERFRLQVVEGLRADEGFNHKIEYGSMWHEMEEGLASAAADKTNRLSVPSICARKLALYRQRLINTYPAEQADIDKWYTLCKMHFPLYVDYWRKHPDQTSRKPVLEEAAFRVPYTLPSGRVVTLRGKFDAVFTAELTKDESTHLYPSTTQGDTKARINTKRALFLQETKTKGEIDELGILHTVAGNLQSMLYQIALRTIAATEGEGQPLGPKPPSAFIDSILQHPIAGTLYNVIRRPLSDRFAPKPRKGREVKVKGTDRKQRKGMESAQQFYDRVIGLIREETQQSLKTNRPSTNFMRWKVILTDEDINRFRREVFDPILEQLCDWWEWIAADPFDPWRPRKPSELSPDWHAANDGTLAGRIAQQMLDELDKPCNTHSCPHYRTPWGIYNSIFGGFRGDYFEYLTEGRKSSLATITNLFPELEP